MTKPVLKIEANEDEVTLVAQGALTVQYAKELQTFLLENVSHKKTVHFQLKEVTALDVAGAQLAYAWKSEIAKSGGRATISLPEDAGLVDLLQKTGITRIF